MKINTATGRIGVDDLGKTLMHEHLVIGFPGWDSDTGQPAELPGDDRYLRRQHRRTQIGGVLIDARPLPQRHWSRRAADGGSRQPRGF